MSDQLRSVAGTTAESDFGRPQESTAGLSAGGPVSQDLPQDHAALCCPLCAERIANMENILVEFQALLAAMNENPMVKMLAKSPGLSLPGMVAGGSNEALNG